MKSVKNLLVAATGAAILVATGINAKEAPDNEAVKAADAQQDTAEYIFHDIRVDPPVMP